MKFLKPMLLTAFAFIGIATTTLFSACEKDSCTDLTCANGGACSGGFCHCTTGYEGAQCEILSEQRFMGTYIGVNTCDTAAGILDTVSIFHIAGRPNTELAIVNSDTHEAIYGNISISGGQYLILVPNQVLNSTTVQKYTISLLNSTRLTVYSDLVVNGTSRVACTFIGNKQ